MSTTTQSHILFLLQAKTIVDTLMDYPDGIPISALRMNVDKQKTNVLLEFLRKHHAIKMNDNIVERDFMFHNMRDRLREFDLLISTESEHYAAENPRYGE